MMMLLCSRPALSQTKSHFTTSRFRRSIASRYGIIAQLSVRTLQCDRRRVSQQNASAHVDVQRADDDDGDRMSVETIMTTKVTMSAITKSTVKPTRVRTTVWCNWPYIFVRSLQGGCMQCKKLHDKDLTGTKNAKLLYTWSHNNSAHWESSQHL